MSPEDIDSFSSEDADRAIRAIPSGQSAPAPDDDRTPPATQVPVDDEGTLQVIPPGAQLPSGTGSGGADGTLEVEVEGSPGAAPAQSKSPAKKAPARPRSSADSASLPKSFRSAPKQRKPTALYMVLRCVGQKSKTIHRGDTITIGRHNSSDLVLNDGTVSRHHAKIVWDQDEDRPYVEDTKSANGVEVDGEFVEGRMHLVGNNQIDIGDFTLVLQLRGDTGLHDRSSVHGLIAASSGAPTSAEEAEARAKGHLIQESMAVKLFSEKGEKVRGQFESSDVLPEILRLLAQDNRTGTLNVTIGAKKTGVTFSRGRIVTAQRGKEDVPSRELLREVLQAEAGSYQFDYELELSEENLNLSVRRLLRDELGTE